MGDGPPADPLGRLLPLMLREPGAADPFPWPSSPAAGDKLVDCLVRHGLAPFFHHLLGNAAPAGLTSEQRARLTAARHGAAASVLAHERALRLLDVALHEHSIRAIVLKGRALAQAAWPDPALRSSCDVDLLIAPDELSVAGEVFRACGWEPAPEGRNKWRPSKDEPGLPPLDVICSPRAQGARNPTWRPDLSQLLSSSEELRGFRSLRVLAPAHAFVHAAVHGMDHAAARLVWLLDLALFLRRLPDLPTLALEHAVQARARRATALALHLTARLFDLPGLETGLPPWGTGWFVHRVLEGPSAWGDEGMERAGRLLLRLTLVDRPGDLLR